LERVLFLPQVSTIAIGIEAGRSEFHSCRSVTFQVVASFVLAMRRNSIGGRMRFLLERYVAFSMHQKIACPLYLMN